MSASYKGALIGAALGLFSGMTSPYYTATGAAVTMAVLALAGWGIGRLIEMRGPRR